MSRSQKCFLRNWRQDIKAWIRKLCEYYHSDRVFEVLRAFISDFNSILQQAGVVHLIHLHDWWLLKASLARRLERIQLGSASYHHRCRWKELATLTIRFGITAEKFYKNQVLREQLKRKYDFLLGANDQCVPVFTLLFIRNGCSQNKTYGYPFCANNFTWSSNPQKYQLAVHQSYLLIERNFDLLLLIHFHLRSFHFHFFFWNRGVLGQLEHGIFRRLQLLQVFEHHLHSHYIFIDLWKCRGNCLLFAGKIQNRDHFVHDFFLDK